MLIMNMTSAHESLSVPEVEALVNFIDAGGSAILNCFSQWSNSGDLGKVFAQLVGVKVVEQASFGAKAKHPIETMTDRRGVEIVRGPFGNCSFIENLGETAHDRRRAEAQNLAPVPLTALMTLFPALKANREAPASGSVFKPPPPGVCAFGGQILLCSNFHWFCSPGHWNGGLIQKADNTKMFLNFAASACRSIL